MVEIQAIRVELELEEADMIENGEEVPAPLKVLLAA